ncbi:hypothetical protein AX27061_4153 [Achromobacter xylosoxidans NBRC 15126 = ATCC 27061]|nr:hypothetical protein AX27061_4153 [Achromobacter xylosoxidans NBRC 15126 = ATCC 27061]
MFFARACVEYPEFPWWRAPSQWQRAWPRAGRWNCARARNGQSGRCQRWKVKGQYRIDAEGIAQRHEGRHEDDDDPGPFQWPGRREGRKPSYFVSDDMPVEPESRVS